MTMKFLLNSASLLLLIVSGFAQPRKVFLRRPPEPTLAPATDTPSLSPTLAISFDTASESTSGRSSYEVSDMPSMVPTGESSDFLPNVPSSVSSLSMAPTMGITSSSVDEAQFASMKAAGVQQSDYTWNSFNGNKKRADFSKKWYGATWSILVVIIGSLFWLRATGSDESDVEEDSVWDVALHQHKIDNTDFFEQWNLNQMCNEKEALKHRMDKHKILDGITTWSHRDDDEEVEAGCWSQFSCAVCCCGGYKEEL